MSDLILREVRERVAILTLNRPEALNALNSALLRDLSSHLRDCHADPDIGAIVLTGSQKAFAAGADIKEMQDRSFVQMYLDDWFAGWDSVASARKPLIAAVSGFALGGGCELAMMCDIILAGDNARFGQPEIKLGVLPGIGGTQRLTRLIGRPRAMELCLTGRMIDAAEADRIGLVTRVVPQGDLLREAFEMARDIASRSQPVVMMTKECVKAAEELSLAEGIRLERRIFHSSFALEDQKEGMAAFSQKRAPAFRHR